MKCLFGSLLGSDWYFFPPIFVLCVTTSQSVAQLAEPFSLEAASLPSPEAYAALKMEDYTSVSNTGALTVSTTLATLESERLAWPVSLSYAVKGVRAEEVASYVGLGWNLSLGASLTRVVTGVPDEWTYGYAMSTSVAAAQEVAEHFPPYATDGTQTSNGRVQQILSVPKQDIGPDAFKYRIGEVSGQFRLNASEGYEYQPQTNARVSDRSDDLSWFDVTHPNGLIYRFGGEDSDGNAAVDIATYGTDPRTHQTKWHLTSVRDHTARHLGIV